MEVKLVKVGISVVSRLIFELKKYKLNYLFKYLKSIAESCRIIITEPT